MGRLTHRRPRNLSAISPIKIRVPFVFLGSRDDAKRLLRGSLFLVGQPLANGVVGREGGVQIKPGHLRR
jgi:hypothetical protein